MRQRFQHCQEIGTLRGKGVQRGPEFQFEIVRLLDPAAGIDRPQRRCVLGDHRHHAVAPHVSTRTQVGKHIVYRPLIVVGGSLQ